MRFVTIKLTHYPAAGCLAYAAATLLFSLTLLKPGSWDDIKGMSMQNVPWFLSSAVLVAISQAFVLRLARGSAADSSDADPWGWRGCR